MERKRKTFTLKTESEKNSTKGKTISRKATGDCNTSQSSSHTQFYMKPRHENEHKRITIDEYFGISESVPGSSETFRCVHGPKGKLYTEKGLPKRNILKELDHIPTDSKWTEKCPPEYGWGIAEKLVFLVMDPIVFQQKERLCIHLKDFATISGSGYNVEVLDNVCILLDFLVENLPKNPDFRDGIVLLLKNMIKPILLNVNSDVVRYFEGIRNYIGFMGYLLLRLEDDQLFDLVSEAIVWQLSAADLLRDPGSAHLRHTLAAAAPVLYQSISRMLAIASAHRFPTFLTIALLLACDNEENCIALMKENIIENIFYRFNPFFPLKKLPGYDINPANPKDYNVKLGDSSVHMCLNLSLLLVLMKSTMRYLDDNPKDRALLPCPDDYAQRCFIWAYRYECKARDHHHERITLTVVIDALLYCYGERLVTFAPLLMPDVMSLSVATELPPRGDWTAAVSCSTAQHDVHFKKLLIHLSVHLLKVFPHNKCVVESRHWLLGLVCMVDPGLGLLRTHCSPALFTELRKTTLQALVCALPFTAPEHDLVRRLMWYIEWYTESPYELSVLYWCLRLLQTACQRRRGEAALRQLYDTHAVVILIQVCYTLFQQRTPPVEKGQVVVALALRVLTSAVERTERVACCVYPGVVWPQAGVALARRILDVALYSLEQHHIVSDKWLIALLNFIWEAIIWKSEYREQFIVKDGLIYKILDIITMSRAPVQCVALALLCDAMRAGSALSQLVSWRATIGASNAHPNVVKRGATIATLLAAIFRDECRATGVPLDHNGVIMELDCPIMSWDVRRALRCPESRATESRRTAGCTAAADVAGSRLSKAFAILHMLTEDLKEKVLIADEAYNMYKNIKLAPEDEAVLVLCSYYLTLKLNEAWLETHMQSPGLLQTDEQILEEFLHICSHRLAHALVSETWTSHAQQRKLNNFHSSAEERSLYDFIGRVRLNEALDALRTVRCVARCADRAAITHALLHDAVRAHHCRMLRPEGLGASVIRTYEPMLDDHVTSNPRINRID